MLNVLGREVTLSRTCGTIADCTFQELCERVSVLKMTQFWFEIWFVVSFPNLLDVDIGGQWLNWEGTAFWHLIFKKRNGKILGACHSTYILVSVITSSKQIHKWSKFIAFKHYTSVFQCRPLTLPNKVIKSKKESPLFLNLGQVLNPGPLRSICCCHQTWTYYKGLKEHSIFFF